MPDSYVVHDESAMHALAAELGRGWKSGDVVFLDGPLGAGKTTFVRGYLESLRHVDVVRSPTFNLIQVFETDPPVMHADLYRLAGWQGIGIEDYLDTHVCLIEWSDRAAGMLAPESVWRIGIEIVEPGRRVTVVAPSG